MKKKQTYPLKQKLLDFIEGIITEIDSNIDVKFPKILELENFAIVEFNYVSFYLEISHEPEHSFKNYSIFLTDKNEFKKEIYSDKSLHVIKRVITELDNLDYVFLVLAREEIFHYYKNPMSFIGLYRIFNEIKSNVNYIDVLNIPEETSNFFVKLFSSLDNISNSFIDESIYKKSHLYESILRSSKNPSLTNYINIFVVYIFVHYEQYSTRRRDHWSNETEYCLYYKGIRVYDEYINSILPKTKKEFFDDYNDSTPGLVRKTTTSFKISYLETEKFHSKYCHEDHIVYLSTISETDEFPIGKVEKQTVFHEYGHIVGWELANLLGYNFGNITQINLDSKKGGAFIKTDNSLFSIQKNKNPYEEYNSDTDFQEQDFKLLEISRIKMNINNDKKRALAYIIYLLSGSIFNLYYFKTNPLFEDFNDIFIDNTELEKFGDFKAKAGNDFRRITCFRDDLDIPDYDCNNFKFLAMELFHLLDFHFIFKKLTNIHFSNLDKVHNNLNILDDFETKYNGRTISDSLEIESIRYEISKKLLENNMFKIGFELLVNKYYKNMIANSI